MPPHTRCTHLWLRNGLQPRRHGVSPTPCATSAIRSRSIDNGDWGTPAREATGARGDIGQTMARRVAPRPTLDPKVVAGPVHDRNI